MLIYRLLIRFSASNQDDTRRGIIRMARHLPSSPATYQSSGWMAHSMTAMCDIHRTVEFQEFNQPNHMYITSDMN